jgi:histidine triad (HIT) family protein
VGRLLRGGGAIASRISATSRSRAASRLRHCDLYSEAAIVTTPSTSRDCSRSSARAFSTSLNAEVPATSKLNSTRLSVVFTDWPPGPLDRENRHANSPSGITTPDRTTNPLSTRQLRQNHRMNACVFCDLITADSPDLFVKEPAAVAFFPLPGEEIAPGHSLVVPRRHTTAGVLDTQPADLAQVMALAQRIAQRMVAGLGATGVCLLNASGPGSGRSLDHLHVHVVPRYPGDGDGTLPWPAERSQHRLSVDPRAVLSG